MPGTRKSISLCQVNVRSICAPSRILDLEILTAKHSFDVLCLTETWLTSSKPSSSILIPGYQCPIRKDRVGTSGGGVAIYVRSGLAVKMIHPPKHITIETACMQVILGKRARLNVVVVYRPPGSAAENFITQLDMLIDHVQGSKQAPLCVVGDFNAKVSDWLPGQITDKVGLMLKQLASSQELAQVVSEATFGVNTKSPSLLDLIFVNKPRLVKSCSVLPQIADHCPTVINLSLSGPTPPKPQVFFTWDFDNADFQSLNACLSATDWSSVTSCTDVDIAVDRWCNQILSSAELHIPRKRHCRRSNSKPWYSPHLHKIAKIKDRLFHLSRGKLADSRIVKAYKKMRNWYVSELRLAELQFFRNIGHRLNSKPNSKSAHTWWSLVKSAAGWSSRQQIPPIFDAAGMVHVSAKDRAEVLNEAFARQCSASPAKQPPSLPRSSSTFSFTTITQESTLKALRNIPTNKASGLDDLPARMLSECAAELAAPLCYIFNLSLSTGVFPSHWKVACIQPVFKNKGDRCDPLSYRPIALLPCISKVFEKLVHRQVLDYSLSNGHIPDQQFGFLPRRSTVWQLLSVTEEWQTALDGGKSVHALFLDVSKAFDRVDHSVMLEKLKAIGFDNPPLRWMKSYLHGRSICTNVERSTSSCRPISSGVPQGSVLGPLLFVLYVSDLPSFVHSSSCAMFADDSLLYNTSCSASSYSNTSEPSSDCCSLQDDTSSVQSWADQWNTLFNAQKSAHMVISRSPQQTFSPQITLGGIPVPYVTCTRHLGLLISSSLKWSAHVESLVSRVSWKVALLKRLLFRCRLSLHIFSFLYTTLLRPCLEYSTAVWDNCSAHDAHSLERIQLSLARSALALHSNCSPLAFSKVDLLRALGWPTLAWRRRRCKLLLFWQLVHGIGPPCLHEKLSSVSTRCNYRLRKPKSIEVPSCSTSAHLSSFLPSCTILWNTLPVSVTSCSSLSSFASLMDTHFVADKFSYGLPP